MREFTRAITFPLKVSRLLADGSGRVGVEDALEPASNISTREVRKWLSARILACSFCSGWTAAVTATATAAATPAEIAADTSSVTSVVAASSGILVHSFDVRYSMTYVWESENGRGHLGPAVRWQGSLRHPMKPYKSLVNLIFNLNRWNAERTNPTYRNRGNRGRRSQGTAAICGPSRRIVSRRLSHGMRRESTPWIWEAINSVCEMFQSR